MKYHLMLVNKLVNKLVANMYIFYDVNLKLAEDLAHRGPSSLYLAFVITCLPNPS
jgi:hypothetical protein